MIMPHRHFRNTLDDLYICLERLKEAGSWQELVEDESEYEREAIEALPTVIAQILNQYDKL